MSIGRDACVFSIPSGWFGVCFEELGRSDCGGNGGLGGMVNAGCVCSCF